MLVAKNFLIFQQSFLWVIQPSTTQWQLSMPLKKKTFGNILGNGENLLPILIKTAFKTIAGIGENDGYHIFSFSHKVFKSSLNPFPYMLILGSSDSAANKTMMSDILSNGVQLSDWVEYIKGKGVIACYKSISSFPTMFSKVVCCWSVKNDY